MGQHSGEPFPRFHLVLTDLLTDGLTQLVQRLLHGPLSWQQTVDRQSEREVTVADGLLHQMRTNLQRPLMTPNPHESHHRQTTYTNYYIYHHLLF